VIQLKNSRAVAFSHAGHRIAALPLSCPIAANYRVNANYW
jgi:hypothetical protein